MPLPAGITSTFLERSLGPLDEVGSGLRYDGLRSRGFCGTHLVEPAASTASEWSRYWVGTTGLTKEAHRPAPAIAFAPDRPRSTSRSGRGCRGTTTRAGYHGKFEVALAFDQLFQRVGQCFRFAAAYELFCQHFGGVGAVWHNARAGWLRLPRGCRSSPTWFPAKGLRYCVS